MATDSELLTAYAENNSEEAFRVVVLRHHRMIYLVALRKLNGDAHRAQEVTQDVFVDLARKAARLSYRSNIIGWLYVSACHAAAKVARASQRKRAAEDSATLAEHVLAESGGDSRNAEINTALDELIVRLKERDREAVLLRYFQGLTFTEIAAKLQLSEDGARLRVSRALEKLRFSLARKGVTSTAAALSATLASQAQIPVQSGLAGTVATGALMQLSISSVSPFHIIIMSKAFLSITCAVVTLGTLSLVYRSYYSPTHKQGKVRRSAQATSA